MIAFLAAFNRLVVELLSPSPMLSSLQFFRQMALQPDEPVLFYFSTPSVPSRQNRGDSYVFILSVAGSIGMRALCVLFTGDMLQEPMNSAVSLFSIAIKRRLSCWTGTPCDKRDMPSFCRPSVVTITTSFVTCWDSFVCRYCCSFLLAADLFAIILLSQRLTRVSIELRQPFDKVVDVMNASSVARAGLESDFCLVTECPAAPFGVSMFIC